MDSSSNTKRSSNITVRPSTQSKRKAIFMKFTCDICQKSFSSKHCLKEHNYKHLDLKPYTCPLCQERFRYISQLASHKEMHEEFTQGLDTKRSENGEAEIVAKNTKYGDGDYELPLIAAQQEFILPKFEEYFKNS